MLRFGRLRFLHSSDCRLALFVYFIQCFIMWTCFVRTRSCIGLQCHCQLFLLRCVAVRVPASQVARMVMYALCSCLLGQSVPYPVTEEGAKWLITCCECLWHYSSGRLKGQAATVEFGQGKLLCWSPRVLKCASCRKSRVTCHLEALTRQEFFFGRGGGQWVVTLRLHIN
jgi:hypothetical protein